MPTSDVNRSKLFGDHDSGTWFDDASMYTNDEPRIKDLFIWCGDQVHGIHVFYTNGKTAYHGKAYGSYHRVSLGEDESIISVEGYAQGYYDQVTFRTSKNNTYGPYGKNETKHFKIDFEAGRELKYIFGREKDGDKYFYKLGFADGLIPMKAAEPKQTVTFGANWAPQTFSHRNVFEKECPSITAVTVYSEGRKGYIKGLAVEYSNGERLEHGIVLGAGADKARFDISAHDYITGVKMYAVNAIDQIEFFTFKHGSFGPVGKEPDSHAKQVAKWNFHEMFPAGSRLLYLEGGTHPEHGLQNLRFLVRIFKSQRVTCILQEHSGQCQDD